MKQWFRKHVDREMVRPLIYKVFTRGILALFAAQLAHFFLPAGGALSSFSNLSLLLGFMFALFAFLAWLRLDGMRIPQLKLPRIKRKDPGAILGPGGKGAEPQPSEAWPPALSRPGGGRPFTE